MPSARACRGVPAASGWHVGAHPRPVKGRAPVQSPREKRWARACVEGGFWGSVRVRGRAGSAETPGEEFWRQR